MTPQELKNSILQLAIQGKLVEQRPEEGTAEELYREIQREKQALIKAGKIKKEKPLPEITEDEVPFEIPEGWKWVRLGNIGYTNIGLTYSPKNTSNTGTIVLRSSNIQDGMINYTDIVYVQMNIPESKMCSKGDILICARNGSKRLVGKAAIIDQDGMSFGAFMAIFRSRYNEYILQVINSAYFRNSLLGDTGTTTINQITQDMLKNAVVPFPPLAEQKRIVAKIEELLPLVDRYEKAWTRLEDFNKRFPSDMQKSILQLAIQGKLVEQRPEEGTGEELYREIQKEKQALIKAGKIKKEKPLPEIAEDEVPFEIPRSWKWVHLIDIASTIGDIDHKMPEKVVNGGYPFISPLDFTETDIDYDNAKQISKKDYLSLSRKIKPERNDIIFPRYGTIGVVRLVKTDRPFIASYSCCIIKPMGTMFPTYIFSVLNTPMIRDEIKKYINKTTQPNVGLKSIKNFMFPLPPLFEQKRIVAKLEELLPLCERLK